VTHNKLQTVQLLLNVSAATNTPAFSYTDTVLPAAIPHGDMALTQILLSHGANIDAADKYGRPALMSAVERKDFALVQLLLSHGADVNAPAQYFGYTTSHTALEIAAFAGDLGLVNLLLAHGASDILAAMDRAACGGHTEIVQALVDPRAHLHDLPIGAWQKLALKAGVECRDHALARQILACGIDVDAPVTEGDPEWSTALQRAAFKGDDHMVRLLISSGANVNAPALGKQGMTALQGAISVDNLELVRYLLIEGANTNAPSPDPYRMALPAAAGNGNLEMVQLLFIFGVNIVQQGKGALESVIGRPADDNHSLEVVRVILDQINGVADRGRDSICLEMPTFDEDRWSSEELYTDMMHLLLKHNALNEFWALMSAIDMQNYELVETLLHSDNADANINTDVASNDLCYDQGYIMSPLESAVVNGGIEIVHLIIANGANQRQVTQALQAAARNNQLEAAEMLLQCGADVNAAPLRTDTPLTRHCVPPSRTAPQAAAENGNIELVRLLLENGAEVERLLTSPNEQGTALQFAAIAGSIGVASELIERGANVNAPSMGEDGRTALEGAAEHGRLDMVQLLLNLEADVRGLRAVQFARREGHDGVVTLLLKNGFEDDVLMSG